MPVYVISYDLNKQGKDYTALGKAIDALTVKGGKVMRSMYIIKANGPARAIYDKLRAAMDQDDYLYVGDLGQDGIWLTAKNWSDNAQAAFR